MTTIETIKKIFSFNTDGVPFTQQYQIDKRVINWKQRNQYIFQSDIKRWKQAESLAKNIIDPQNQHIQNIFTGIMDDLLLTSQINNRMKGALSMPFVLRNPKGEVDQQQTKALKKHHLFRFLSEKGLESIYYGATIVQMGLNNKGKLTAEILPRTNIVQQTGSFFPDIDSRTNSIQYREIPEFGTYILEYNSGNIGLINKVVPAVIFLQYAMKCWVELCEIYGIPPRVMKTNTTDPAQMARSEQMMKDMGSASWFIIDKNEEFEFAQQVNTKGEVFESLISLCSSRISLAISGTVIGQDTKFGNKGKEINAQDMLWYIIQDDMEMLQQQWNTINIPALMQHGVLKGDLTFEFLPAEDLAQMWKMTTEAMPYFEIDQDWIKQKFGIEIIGTKTSKIISPTPSDKKKAADKNNLSFFLEASQSGAMTCCGQTLTTINLSGNLNNDQLITRFFEDKGERKFDAEMFNFSSENLTKGFSKGWKKSQKAKLSLTIGVEYGFDDPAALTAYEMNIFRFGGIKTLAESQLLNRAFRESKSFNEFKIRASTITKIHNEEWLKTEYNTAYAVGQSSATYARLITQTELFPYWQYQTIGDSKVRDEHSKIDGLILPANHPLWAKIYPPNGWNCRCFVNPKMANELQKQDIEANISTFEAFVKSEEFQKATKSGWGINRAITEEVFTANQQYVTNITEANKLLSELGPGDYKMRQPKIVTDIIPYEKSPIQFWQENQKEKLLEFFDYNNRKIQANSDDYYTAITNETLLDELKFILKKPDEVWFKAAEKGQTFNQFLYVKYYNGEAIAVEAELKEGKLTLISLKKITDFLIRWGLLIKN